MNVHIIWFGRLSLRVCSKSLERRCFAIWIAFSILSTNIIVFGILPMAPLLGMRKSRSLNPVLRIGLTMHVKFDQLNDCLYIRDGKKSFSKTWMYSRMLNVIMADNRQIRIIENISLKCPSIQYSFWKFCQPQIRCASSMTMQTRRRSNLFFLFLTVYY